MSKSKNKDQQALLLFQAAQPLTEIRDRLQFRSVTSTQAAINRALQANSRAKDAETLHRLENERLDSLYRGIYPAALKGDVQAIDRCLKISETRSRMSASVEGNKSSLVDAYDRTVEAVSGVDDGGKDEAIVSVGRTLVEQIDWAVKHGVGQEVTKALYLVPHLMNVLRELGATPAVRGSLKEAIKEKSKADSSGKISSLDAFRGAAFK